MGEEAEHSRPRLWLIIYIFHTRGRVCYIITPEGGRKKSGQLRRKVRGAKSSGMYRHCGWDECRKVFGNKG